MFTSKQVKLVNIPETLYGLKIHDIFAIENIKKDGHNPTSNIGFGIVAQMKNADSKISFLKIMNCWFERPGRIGIRVFGYAGSQIYLASLLENEIFCNCSNSF